jgi:hypothetical protein
MMRKVIEESVLQGVDPRLALAVAEVESSFDPTQVSPQGARGIMQLMPETAARRKVNIDDPNDNIRGGIGELKDLHTANKNDVVMALRRYNASPDADPSVTQPYVEKVLQTLQKYRGLEVPDAASVLRLPVLSAKEALLQSVQPVKGPVRSQVAPTALPIGTAETIGPGPGVLSRIARETLPATGAVIGGYRGGGAGFALAAPTGNPYAIAALTAIGAMTGAAIGAWGGEELQVSLEQLGSRMGLSTAKPPTLEASLRRGTEAAYTGALMEGVGNIAGRTILQPLAGKLTPFAKEAFETFRTASGDPLVLPGEVTTSRTMQFLQNIVEGSIWGGGRIAAVRTARDKLADEKVKAVIDSLGPVGSQTRIVRRIQSKLPSSPAVQAQRALMPAVRQAQTARSNVEQIIANNEAERVTEAAVQAASRETAAGRLGTGFGPVRDVGVVGAQAMAAREAAVTAFRAEETAAWTAFDEVAETIQVGSTPLLNEFVERETGRAQGSLLPNAGLTAARQALQKVNPPLPEHGLLTGTQSTQAEQMSLQQALREALQQQGALPPPLTAAQFATTVSDIKRLVREFIKQARTNPSKYAKQAGTARKLLSIARQEINQVLQGADEAAGVAAEEGAFAKYTTANAVSWQGNARLFNKSVMEAIRKDPEDILALLLRKNQSTPITRMRDAIGDVEMQPLQAAAWHQLIVRDPKTGGIDWLKTHNGLVRIGDNTLYALFPNRQTDGLKRLARGVFEAERNAATAVRTEKAWLETAKEGVAAAKTRLTEGVEAAKQAELARHVADPLSVIRNKRSSTAVIKALIDPDNKEALDAVQAAVGDPGMGRLRRVTMQHLIQPNPKTGQIEWTNLKGRLELLKPEGLTAMFPGGQMNEIRRVVNLMAELEKKGPGTGRVAIQLAQGGLLAGAAGLAWVTDWDRASVGAAAGVLLTPVVLAHLMSHPTGVRWLSIGLAAKPGTPSAKQAAAHLTAFLLRDYARESSISSSIPFVQPPPEMQRPPQPSPAR